MKVLFYHRQSVNAIPLSISFPLPSACFSKRSPIHVGSLEGFNLSPANCKRFTASHILSLADVGDCRGEKFCVVLWFYCFCFDFSQTAPQAVIFSHFSKSVCELKADVSAAGSCIYFFCHWVCGLPASSVCPQAIIVAFRCKLVCGLCAGSACCCGR